MIIIYLRSHSCISRVGRVIVLPVHIHKTVKKKKSLSDPRPLGKIFNPYFVTKRLLVDRYDLKPSCSKTMLISNPEVICEIMTLASCST